MTGPDVRTKVEKGLRRQVPDETWSRLVAKGYVDDVLYGGMTVDQLVSNLRFARDVMPAKAALAKRSGGMPSPASVASVVDDTHGWLAVRSNALVLLVSQLAEADNEVQQFRRQHGLDPVLAELDVLAWLQQCWERDRPEGWCWPDFTGTPRDGGRPWETHDHVYLRCWVPQESVPWVATRHPVPARGTLASLADLADQLADRYAWQVEQAATFVLTGLQPNYDALSATTTIRGTCPVASRVVLTIDPAVPPARVSAFYSRLRRQVLQLDSTGSGTKTADEKPSRVGRVRPVSERSFALATFLAKRPEGEPLAEAQQAWNAAHPDWRYASYPSFWRQARDVKKLVCPSYDVPE